MTFSSRRYTFVSLLALLVLVSVTACKPKLSDEEIAQTSVAATATAATHTPIPPTETPVPTETPIPPTATPAAVDLSTVLFLPSGYGIESGSPELTALPDNVKEGLVDSYQFTVNNGTSETANGGAIFTMIYETETDAVEVYNLLLTQAEGDPGETNIEGTTVAAFAGSVDGREFVLFVAQKCQVVVAATFTGPNLDEDDIVVSILTTSNTITGQLCP